MIKEGEFGAESLRSSRNYGVQAFVLGQRKNYGFIPYIPNLLKEILV